MGEPAVLRLRGLNLRVRDLDRALAFYTRLGLRVKGAFGREAFLRWTAHGEDFLGLFRSRSPGWHHLELRFQAATVPEALRHLEDRGLWEEVRSLGSTELRPEALRRQIPSGIEVVPLLIHATLFAELPDPDGRTLELVYLKERYAAREAPGLQAVEVVSPQPEAVEAFYSRLGLERTPAGLRAASGQELRVLRGDRPEGVRATMVVAPAVWEALARTRPARTAEGEGLTLRDPEGHEWLVLPLTPT